MHRSRMVLCNLIVFVYYLAGMKYQRDTLLWMGSVNIASSWNYDNVHSLCVNAIFPYAAGEARSRWSVQIPPCNMDTRWVKNINKLKECKFMTLVAVCSDINNENGKFWSKLTPVYFYGCLKWFHNQVKQLLLFNHLSIGAIPKNLARFATK